MNKASALAFPLLLRIKLQLLIFSSIMNKASVVDFPVLNKASVFAFPVLNKASVAASGKTRKVRKLASERSFVREHFFATAQQRQSYLPSLQDVIILPWRNDSPTKSRQGSHQIVLPKFPVQLVTGPRRTVRTEPIGHFVISQSDTVLFKCNFVIKHLS